MKKVVNIKTLKKKNAQKEACRKTQTTTTGDDSGVLSSNEKESQFIEDEYKLNQNNEDVLQNDKYQTIPKQKQKDRQYKKELTTLELQDLKIQQDLLDIAESARSKDSFGPWLPPPKQQIKQRSKSKNENRSKQQKSNSQNNITVRPFSTLNQYNEEIIQQLQNGENLKKSNNFKNYQSNLLQQNIFNQRLLGNYQNGEIVQQYYTHNQSQEKNDDNSQYNQLLSRKQVHDFSKAGVQNVLFKDDLEYFQDYKLNQNIYKESSSLYQEKISKTSPKRKVAYSDHKQMPEKRIYTDQYCNNHRHQSHDCQQNNQQKQYRYISKQINEKIQQGQVFSPSQNLSQFDASLFIKPPGSQKNCYNMPIRTILPRFLKNKAKQIKSDYNQYIKGHSQKNSYNQFGRNEEDLKRYHQEKYCDDISEQLNKTLNTFNFNSVMYTNDYEQSFNDYSQQQRYSTIMRSKQSYSPTKRQSMEHNQTILINQQAPKVKVYSKESYKSSQQGVNYVNGEKQRVHSQVNEDTSNHFGDEEQFQIFNFTQTQENLDTGSSSFILNKKQKMNTSKNLKKLLLDNQQTATTEITQGDISYCNQEKFKQKEQIFIKQMNDNFLDVNLKAITQLNADNHQKQKQISLKNDKGQKNFEDQKPNQGKPISQKKLIKPLIENVQIENNRQIQNQFKLSNQKGNALITQQQNEKVNLSINGVNQLNQNSMNCQNSTTADQKNINNGITSVVQRKISKALSQIGNNSSNSKDPQNFAQNSVDKQYEENIIQQITQQDQSILALQKDNALIQNIIHHQRRRVVSAHSNYPEEIKRFSLHSNNLTYQKNRMNENSKVQAFTQKKKEYQDQINENMIINGNNSNNDAIQEIKLTNNSMLVPRNVQSHNENYRKEHSNEIQLKNNNQSSNINHNHSFDNESNIKSNLLKNQVDIDNPKNFMNSVDAQLLFNVNSLEFNGRNSLQSYDYQKKRQSYIKSGFQGQQKQNQKPNNQNKQITQTDPKPSQIQNSMPSIDQTQYFLLPQTQINVK